MENRTINFEEQVFASVILQLYEKYLEKLRGL